MARSVAPLHTRSEVKKAGRAIRAGSARLHDHQIIENFRASHVHVLNGFQASLRNRARSKDITVAQRLKRRVTIYDKLTRRPNFSLTEMQDIAGCRLIFKNTQELQDFRSSYHRANFSHKLLSENDRYNYIISPKPDGYRGIHDVYEYCGRSSSSKPWDGLRIELQYRTIYQHAWATAVEVAGLLTGNEHKFGRAAQAYSEFFCLTSELIARSFEASTSCRPDLTISEIAKSILEIDQEIKILNLFEQYNSVALNVTAIHKNAILIFNKRPEKYQERTKILRFSSFSDAVRKLEKIEQANVRDGDPYDVVLVRSVEGPKSGSIQSAFRNYFADTRDFVSYVQQGLNLAPNSHRG
ncbi:RelA/SpoT domain-containing protein [Natronohydrobacter thiooxidans]|uniref:RelA/SpoT domain-containing protein n=1 Tax=Natronohydrobacter thiooxidans TaxID=87172 RepID=UPI000A00D289|nr:RelA/SpoT domain-containing protein [Natronohydrobacter thiooxidans]